MPPIHIGFTFLESTASCLTTSIDQINIGAKLLKDRLGILVDRRVTLVTPVHIFRANVTDAPLIQAV